MKGSIGEGLQLLVQKKFGEDKWEQILTKSDLPKNFRMFSHHDIDDEIIVKMIKNTCDVLGLTMEQTADAFGEYWIHEYAKTKYFAFFKVGKSAKDFILNMNRVHEKLTASIPNAKPPAFFYEEIDDKTITMSYHSDRHLEEMWIGLIKGVGTLFNEKITIQRMAKNKVRLIFG